MTELTSPTTPEQPENVADLIAVSVEPRFIKAESSADKAQHVFSYRVTIKNGHTSAVQVLGRYWKITDGNGSEEEVSGKGVVGEQPVIPSGEQYVYTSGAVFPTPIGFMQGHLELLDVDKGETFKVLVPTFRLAMPSILQ